MSETENRRAGFFDSHCIVIYPMSYRADFSRLPSIKTSFIVRVPRNQLLVRLITRARPPRRANYDGRRSYACCTIFITRSRPSRWNLA